jgi:pimeloyl-ACP methyl ester carboxylesterase
MSVTRDEELIMPAPVPRRIDLPIGPVDVRFFGPDRADAPTAVFVHGFLVNGTLWDAVAERLAAVGVRSVVPDWPLGSHRTPLRVADLSPGTVADAVLDLLEALDLHAVVLVGNDTGGAICQLALRGDHRRVGGLVLTNGDAFEVFPPAFFVPLFTVARHRPTLWAMLQATRPAVLRHSALAYGQLLRRPRSGELTLGWVRPALDDPEIRRDLAAFARGLDRRALRGSAGWLARFAKPVRLVWGSRDRHFRVELARRLAETFPDAALTELDDASTFVPVDRPDAVAAAVRDLLVQQRVA